MKFSLKLFVGIALLFFICSSCQKENSAFPLCIKKPKEEFNNVNGAGYHFVEVSYFNWIKEDSVDYLLYVLIDRTKIDLKRRCSSFKVGATDGLEVKVIKDYMYSDFDIGFYPQNQKKLEKLTFANAISGNAEISVTRKNLKESYDDDNNPEYHISVALEELKYDNPGNEIPADQLRESFTFYNIMVGWLD